MTEAEWLACTQPPLMLQFLQGRLSARKLRLFAVACCRGVDMLLMPDSLQALEVAESLAEGRIDNRARKRARKQALAAGWVGPPEIPESLVRHARGPAKQSVACVLTEDPLEAATFTAHLACQAAAMRAWNRVPPEQRPRSDTQEWRELSQRIRTDAATAQACLLRHCQRAPKIGQP